MLKDLSRWKMCSLMVAFIFFFNTTGLAGLAIASNLPQSESSDSALLLSQKIQEVSTSLKLIKNDINSGNGLAAHLNDLNQRYEEIDQLGNLISVELGEVQTEVTELVEQGTLTSEFLERSTDFANYYQQNLAVILEGVSEMLNAPQVSVEQVDNVLNNIKKLSPEIKANILGSKNGPELITRRSDIPKRGPILKSDRIMDVLPTDGDITVSTDVRITPEIEKLAGELNHDVKEIFSYVRNTINYQPYYGSVKGSVGTYWEKAGNDFDQSSFLIALLRASDIPARYVAGEVGLPIQMVMNWVGVETAEAAIEVFSSNGIPSEAVTSGSGKIIGLKFYHVWVEAYNEHGRWVGMDPSFKQYRYHAGIDLDAVIGLDVNATYASILEVATVTDDYIVNLNQVNIAASAEASKQALESYIQTNMPDATADDIFGYREIVQKAKGIFPPTDNGGPFGISEERERFSEVPASLRHLVNFQVSGINYTIAAPGIAEESISVSYVPATSQDAALVDYYGGIFNTPAFLVCMKPVLRINGEAVAEGSSAGLGSRQVLYSSFLAPEEEIWSTNGRHLTAGAEYSIVLDLQQVSARLIEARTNRLEALAVDLPDGELIPQELTEEVLHLTGLTYFAGVDAQSSLLAKRLGIVWTRQPAQAILAKEVQLSYLFWIPWRLSRASRSIDVKRNILNPISVTGEQDHETAWMIGAGTLGSNMEHTIFKELFDVDAVSTIRILGLAGQQGVPVYLVTEDNIEAVLPELSTYSVVKDNIREAIAQGWIAVCPQRNMSLGDWTGQGWLIIDPASGSAGYLLAGGLVTNNVIDVTCGGSTTKKAKGDFKEGLIHFLTKLSEVLLIVTLAGKIRLYFTVLIYYLACVWGGGLGMAFLYGIFFMGVIGMFLWLAATFVYLQYREKSGTAWYRRRCVCYA